MKADNELRYSRSELPKEVAAKIGLLKRSITPDTLKEITFEKSVEDLYYKEHYRYKDNEVTRFAINYSYVQTEDLKSVKTLDTSKEKIESVKTTVYKDNKTKEIINNLLHSNLEKNLIQEAVNHLLNNKEVKTAVVDILERSIDQVICTNGTPGIHTVVLYKNPAVTDLHEIVVIDPSNFFFSSHLSNEDIKSNIKHELLDKILTKHDAIQIYTPPNKENVGPNPNQWRECIDVGVKLAFALNKGTDFKIDFNSITKYPFVQMISNMPNIDKNIIDKDDAVRIKQSSNICEVKKFKACTEAINKNKKIALSINEDLSTNISSEYNKLLAEDVNYSTLIDKLLYFDKGIKESIQGVLEADYSQLIGTIEQYSADKI